MTTRHISKAIFLLFKGNQGYSAKLPPFDPSFETKRFAEYTNSDLLYFTFYNFGVLHKIKEGFTQNKKEGSKGRKLR